MNSIGKELRMSKLFRSDGRCVLVAMDHGGFMGAAPGWEDPSVAIQAVIKGGADAVMTTFGVVQHYHKYLKGRTSLVLSTTLSQPEMTNTVEAATSLGADALKLFITMDGTNDGASLQGLWSASLACASHGIPLLAEMFPVKSDKISNPTSKEVVGKYARMGAEFGADIIKTFYTGDGQSFKEVTSGCFAPILILGGNRTETDLELLKTIETSVKAGGGGVAVGRNIWQNKDPERITRAIVRVVHEGLTAEEADRA